MTPLLGLHASYVPPPARECCVGTPDLLETRCVGFRPTLPREELFSLVFEWGGRKSPYCAFTAVTVHPYVVGLPSVIYHDVSQFHHYPERYLITEASTHFQSERPCRATHGRRDVIYQCFFAPTKAK